jgi:hypothetical protein
VAEGVGQVQYERGGGDAEVPGTRRDHPQVVVQDDDGGHPGHGVVAMPPGDLGEGGPGARGQRGKERRDRELAGPKRRLQRPGEELRRRDGPPAPRGGGLHGAAEHRQHGRQLGGGVGVRQAAHHGAAVADHRVGDVP